MKYSAHSLPIDSKVRCSDGLAALSLICEIDIEWHMHPTMHCFVLICVFRAAAGVGAFYGQQENHNYSISK